MERKKYLCFIIVSLINTNLWGQSNNAIYKSYIKGDMISWKRIIDSLENVKNQSANTLYELINFQYGYVAWCIGNKKSKEAEEYLKKAYVNLELSKNKNLSESQYFAYKSAFIGFEIGIHHYKAPLIGKRSLAYANKAVHANNKNGFAYFQLGNVYFHMPVVVGGSKVISLENYLKAIKLYESDHGKYEKNWNYLNLLVAIINNYYELEQYEEAKRYCLKALTVEPDFDWVKNHLYVKILNKLKK